MNEIEKDKSAEWKWLKRMRTKRTLKRSSLEDFTTELVTEMMEVAEFGGFEDGVGNGDDGGGGVWRI